MCVYVQVPEQNNFCDCGIFVLQYVESILKVGNCLLLGVLQMYDMYGCMHVRLPKYHATVDVDLEP